MRFFAFVGLAALALAAPLPQIPQNSTAIKPSTVAVNSKFGWLIKARDVVNFIPVNSKWLIKKSENSEDSETTETSTAPHINGKWLIKNSEPTEDSETKHTTEAFTTPHVNGKWLIKKSEDEISNAETAQPFAPPHVNSKWLIKKSAAFSNETKTEPETAASAAASNIHVSSKFGWLIRRVFWLPKRETRQLLRLPHSYPEEADAEDSNIAVPFKA